MKTIIRNILAVGVLAAAASCSDWTVPENMNFRRPSIEEADPAGYAKYLDTLRNYKASEHHIMIVGMTGNEAHPSSQNSHPMAMPDSADYIIMTVAGKKLNETIAAEISEVKEKKGTEVLLSIDYSKMSEAWGLVLDKKDEEGSGPATVEEITAFFAGETEKLLKTCSEYGFHGICLTYEDAPRGDKLLEAAQAAVVSGVKAYIQSHEGAKLFFRGGARNIADTEFLEMCDYGIIIAREEKKLSVLPGRILGSSSPLKDKVVMELTVPSSDEPAQLGLSAPEAAQWLLTELESKSFTPKGLSVSNGADDYYCKEMAFYHIRKAISIMNPKE